MVSVTPSFIEDSIDITPFQTVVGRDSWLRRCDSSYQECVLQAVHATSFGTPIGFSCQGRVAVEIDGAGGVN